MTFWCPTSYRDFPFDQIIYQLYDATTVFPGIIRNGWSTHRYMCFRPLLGFAYAPIVLTIFPGISVIFPYFASRIHVCLVWCLQYFHKKRIYTYLFLICKGMCASNDKKNCQYGQEWEAPFNSHNIVHIHKWVFNPKIYFSRFKLIRNLHKLLIT